MKEDDYETLAGMILYYHGSIPVANEIIRIRNLVIKEAKWIFLPHSGNIPPSK